MNFLIISQEFPPAVGGAGIVAAQNACELNRQGHDVTVVTRDWGVCSYVEEDINVIKVKGIKALWPFFIYFRLKKMSLEKFNVIILNDIGAAMVFICLLRRKEMYGRSVYYLHGGEVEDIIRNPKGYIKIFGFKNKFIDYLPASKGVIAVSDHMKFYFLESLPIELSCKKITTVYAGVSSRDFFYVESDIFSELRRSCETVVLSVSRITKEKGYLTKIRIFKDAIKSGRNLHWVIVGGGPYLYELKKKAKEYGVDNNITFRGPVSRDQLREYYSSADLFWLLSERESFGLVYLEAQLCGCPAVGYSTHGVAEAIKNGVTGYLLERPEDFLPLIKLEKYKNLNRNDISNHAKELSLGSQVLKLVSVLQ